MLLDKCDPRLVSWLGGSTTILDYLHALRASKMGDLFQEVSAQSDPLGSGGGGQAVSPGKLAAPPGKRKDLATELPRYIEIEAVIGETSHTILILASWHDSHKIWIELSEANLAALLSDAPEEFQSSAPKDTNQPNVKYSVRMKRVYCYYWDATKSKKRMHTEPVKITADDPGATQQEIDKMALLCQNFYDSNHPPAAEGDGDGEGNS